MDMMEIRRTLMMNGANGMGKWKTKKITAPSNMTEASQVKAWLETEGLIPACEYGFIFIEKDRQLWSMDDFVLAPLLDGHATLWGTNNTNGWYARARGSTYNTQYYQQRGFQNTTETVNVYQGDTFMIFYQ